MNEYIEQLVEARNRAWHEAKSLMSRATDEKRELSGEENETLDRIWADIDAKDRQGELPPPPDFSAPTHARFRAKLAALVEPAGKADASGLRAIQINPVSSNVLISKLLLLEG